MKNYLSFCCFLFFIFLQLSCQKEPTLYQNSRTESLLAGNPVLASTTIISSTGEAIPVTCGQLRTQSPGGWGAPPHGENPASYLSAYFSAAFGSLTIGCAGGYTLSVSSASVITKLLPTGGLVDVLHQNQINPSNIDNVLVGHLISLMISAGFDLYDPNFGAAEVHLGDMIINSGPFMGMKVNSFIQVANDVIGGCSTSYSVQQVLETTAAINENYVDGTRNNGFLKCPEEIIPR